MSEPRYCAMCDKPLERRPDELAGNFNRRKTCGGKCHEAYRVRRIVISQNAANSSAASESDTNVPRMLRGLAPDAFSDNIIEKPDHRRLPRP